jgi:glycosyltransferase involved in cell wall biosynthesis
MISICITCKNRSKLQAAGDYLYLLPNCIDSIIEASESSQTPLEIVVTDWHSDDWPLEEWLPEKLLYTKVSYKLILLERESFSLGYGRNAAVEHATYDNIFFLDADMLLNERVLTDAIESANAGHVFFPICCDEYTGKERHGAFGNSAMSKEIFYSLGKWQEKEEWGGEDLNYFNRCGENGIQTDRDIYTDFIHQWHPRWIGWEGARVHRKYLIHPQRLKMMSYRRKRRGEIKERKERIHSKRLKNEKVQIKKCIKRERMKRAILVERLKKRRERRKKG